LILNKYFINQKNIEHQTIFLKYIKKKGRNICEERDWIFSAIERRKRPKIREKE
jgi:hypothetical protein